MNADKALMHKLRARGVEIRGFAKWVRTNTDIGQGEQELGMAPGDMKEILRLVPDGYYADGNIFNLYEVIVTNPMTKVKWHYWAVLLDYLDFFGYSAELIHIQNGITHALPWHECARIYWSECQPKNIPLNPETRRDPFHRL